MAVLPGQNPTLLFGTTWTGSVLFSPHRIELKRSRGTVNSRTLEAQSENPPVSVATVVPAKSTLTVSEEPFMSAFSVTFTRTSEPAWVMPVSVAERACVESNGLVVGVVLLMVATTRARNFCTPTRQLALLPQRKTWAGMP